jgi:hypothetical protein
MTEETEAIIIIGVLIGFSLLGIIIFIKAMRVK